MAKLVQAPPKFLPPEWHQSNFVKYNNAEEERTSSERLIDESGRLIDEVEKTSRRTQRDVNTKLVQRVNDINYWKTELELKLTELKNERDCLINYKIRLEGALDACNEPLAIAQECLVNRESRFSIDLVHDKVEIDLMKEVEVIQGVQALLARSIEQSIEQTRRNRSAIFYLEKDLTDKAIAQGIDTFCSGLHNNSADIGYHANVVKIESNSVTPDDWRAFSNANIEKAERERASSVNLRALIDSSLKTTTDDMRQQCDAVNLAFSERIAEMKQAKTKLEKHLHQVQVEIGCMEKNITELKKAIQDKCGPMMVAQQRLKTRTDRPNVELCRDPVQYRLIAEVNELQQSIDALNAQLYSAECELKALTRNQLLLEEDIQVKTTSLYIDDVQCRQIRDRICLNYF